MSPEGGRVAPDANHQRLYYSLTGIPPGSLECSVTSLVRVIALAFPGEDRHPAASEPWPVPAPRGGSACDDDSPAAPRSRRQWVSRGLGLSLG